MQATLPRLEAQPRSVSKIERERPCEDFVNARNVHASCRKAMVDSPSRFSFSLYLQSKHKLRTAQDMVFLFSG